MPLYQTGGYQVKPSGVNKVKQAIKEFVAYVQASEPGTHMHLAWQQKDAPTRFLHLFIFKDAAAQTLQGQSETVRRFESIYSPELVGGEVHFYRLRDDRRQAVTRGAGYEFFSSRLELLRPIWRNATESG